MQKDHFKAANIGNVLQHLRKHARVGAIYLPRVSFVLEQNRFASVTWLITDINNCFLSREKGNKEASDNYNNDDNENKWNKVKHGCLSSTKITS